MQKGSFGDADAVQRNSQLILSTKGRPRVPRHSPVEAWVCPRTRVRAFSSRTLDRLGSAAWSFASQNDSREANRFAWFLRLADGSMEPRVSSALAADANQWQHVAVVWDGVYLQLR